MAKLRFDKLPMDRAAQQGGGGAIFEKREIKPGAETLERRHGSVRGAETATALGATCPGPYSRLELQDVVNPDTADYTFSFSKLLRVCMKSIFLYFHSLTLK